MRQIGVADLSLPSLMGKGEGGETLPAGQFVVVANVEETAQRFGEQSEGLQSRFERTFSRAHFYKTFNGQLAEDAAGRSQHLSEADADVLLTFLSRDKGAVLYDGKTVKIKAPGEAALTAITDEDVSIAQLKELLEYLTHQTALLGKRVEELTAAAKDAVVKKNRVAALAALKSKKLAESTLERRFATVNQLEEVAAKIEQAVDNVQLVKVMESSSEALRSLHAQVGGVEGVEDVVDRLREQTAAADEVNSILAESAGTMVVDEGEIDDELAALEGEETRKLAQAERQKQETEQARREAEQTREAEEIRKRLDAVEKLSAQQEQEERRAPAEAEAQAAERLMSRMSLDERPEPQAAT
ncbi:Snf7-domain-containing protein [Lasiosphaeria miniovina]|uniref:Snf7-domain-containing protein n=1 Tax=Lasiosphaeria miniovina TaxID=1954250 RepID=A0AA40DFZ4_9PEZI|nr:Snf7-domain-containing protein [Lasiosphaeria miniovina]KAK0701645.1 Snf7-domain-containing protein [Lasiosphaeria miniovina]